MVPGRCRMTPLASWWRAEETRALIIARTAVLYFVHTDNPPGLGPLMRYIGHRACMHGQLRLINKSSCLGVLQPLDFSSSRALYELCAIQVSNASPQDWCGTASPNTSRYFQPYPLHVQWYRSAVEGTCCCMRAARIGVPPRRAGLVRPTGQNIQQPARDYFFSDVGNSGPDSV